MAPISAAQVKALREQTGVGMMECKNALVECEGDMERAVKILREKGAAKAVKRAGRAIKEGRIQAKVSGDNLSGAMVEVNIETDFAARNDRFVELVDVACDTALAGACNEIEALLDAKPASGEADSLRALVTDIQTVIGENMAVGRCGAFQVPEGQNGMVRTYIHPPGKVGVMVELKCENDASAQAGATAELAHDLCLQIAFSNPLSVDSSAIAPEVIDSEKEVYRNTALKQGKPENLLDKIVEGRMRAFFKESCLLEQAFVKEEKKSVSELLDETSKAVGGKIEIVRFLRYQLGDS